MFRGLLAKVRLRTLMFRTDRSNFLATPPPERSVLGPKRPSLGRFGFRAARSNRFLGPERTVRNLERPSLSLFGFRTDRPNVFWIQSGPF